MAQHLQIISRVPIERDQVGQEIAALAEFSSRAYALGAGSWRARAWLGRPDRLVEGAPADLVAFDRDPRDDLEVLRHPRLILLRGTLI